MDSRPPGRLIQIFIADGEKRKSVRVDAHLHVNFRGCTPARILRYLDAQGLDRAWLLTWEEERPAIPSMYHPLPIADVIEAWREYPSRIVPMYAPDPRRPGALQDLRAWHGKGIRGIGELKVGTTWDSPAIGALLQEAAALHLPVIFHMEGPGYHPFPWSLPNRIFSHTLNRTNWIGRWAAGRGVQRGLFPGYLPDFTGLARRLSQFPSVTFIGHGPLFWKGIARDQGDTLFPQGPVAEPGVLCSLLAAHPNLHADLSGRGGHNALSRDPAFARRFLARFSRRILFGTDNFSLGLPRFLEGLALEPADLRRIMGENAETLLGGTGGG